MLFFPLSLNFFLICSSQFNLLPIFTPENRVLFFRRYNLISQSDFYWFFISLSKCHAYCVARGQGQTPLCCPVIWLVGHSLQCSRCHSPISCCDIYCQIICKEWTIHSISSSPNIPLIAIRKRVILSTPSCGIPKSECLFCEMDPPTLILIHLSLISFLMNSIILPRFPTFHSYLSVFSLLTLLKAFSILKKIAAVFSLIYQKFLILCLLCCFFPKAELFFD